MPATTTTLPTADSICIGGGSIEKASVRLGNLEGAPGDETFLIAGTLVPPPGVPVTVDPAHRGLQILLEDLGTRIPILDLTASRSPIPPGGPGSGCDPKDGWRRLLYRNLSGAVDPPLCPADSAQGLRAVRLKDKLSKTGKLRFLIKGRGAVIGKVTGPLRVTIVLAADAQAGLSGECSSRAFEQRNCKTKRASFRCK